MLELGSPMDPLALSSVSNLAQALLLRQGLPPEAAEALLKLAGQELSLLLLAQEDGGARLQLPTGQVVTAQGELPFPEGTQLRVRVMAEAAGLRLTTLEARPPEQPELLAPLTQGEAAPLLARLGQPDLPEPLQLLATLLRTLGFEPPRPGPTAPPVIPARDLPALAQALTGLPSAELSALSRVLGLPEGAPPLQLAEALVVALQPPPAGDGRLVQPSPGGARPGGEDPLARLLGLYLKAGEAEPAPGDPVIQLMRRILGPPAEAPAAQAAQAGPHAERPAGSSEAKPLPPSPTVLRLAEALKVTPAPPPAVPESWEAWVPATVKALSDPSASPREAPFHALQAKEGTGFFEVPIPWAGGGALHLWVEEDAPDDAEGRKPGGEPVKRVLMGLNMSGLGETRVGLQHGGGLLAVRIWAERTDGLEAGREALIRDLQDLGHRVDLRIMALEPGAAGIPSLRALVTGSSLEAMA